MLWGGITALPPDAPFPLYRDVDVVIVRATGGSDHETEVSYGGLMLEVSDTDLASFTDVERTLANPSSAPNIAATTILADPLAIIAPYQAAVRTDFARRRWIAARVEAEKESAREQLAAMRRATVPTDAVNDLWLLFYALSGMLAVAALDRPTTRRTMALIHDLLVREGRDDLNEQALAIWGAAHLDRDDVRAMLLTTTRAYDDAVRVRATPTPMGFTIEAHLRPYLVEASEEMIAEGLHREATFWIQAMAGEAYLILANDAPDADKPRYAAELRHIYDTLGYDTLDAWHTRTDRAEQLTATLFALADTLVERHPE